MAKSWTTAASITRWGRHLPRGAFDFRFSLVAMMGFPWMSCCFGLRLTMLHESDGVSFAKISKVLQLKLPSLFPILDSHIARSYSPAAKMLGRDYLQLGWR